MAMVLWVEIDGMGPLICNCVCSGPRLVPIESLFVLNNFEIKINV